MYSGFDLMLTDEDFAESLTLTQGKNLYSAQKIKMESQLDSFFDAHGNLNAAKMQEIWFPSIDAHIFISHSHKDKDTAIRLAGWLKNELGLDSFIDSCVWGGLSPVRWTPS